MTTPQGSFWKSKRMVSLAITLCFAVILTIGMINSGSYGIGYDQNPEQNILFMNLRPYFQLLLGADDPRTEMLGDEDVCESIERDHGAAPMYIAAPFCVSHSFRDNPGKWIIAYRCCVFFIFWLGLIALYLLTKRLTDNPLFSMFAVGALWLSPRFFAESTYNNKDALALACVLVSIYFGYRFYEAQGKGILYPVLFGITSAFSVNVRITGIVLLGLIGLAYMIRVTFFDKWNSKYFLKGVIAIASFVLSFYLITPAMWHGHALSFVKYVTVESASFSRWDNYLMAAGEIFKPSIKPIPWWYVISFMFVTIPPLVSIIFLIGIVTVTAGLFLKKRDKEKTDNIFVFSILMFWVSVIVFSIVSHTNLYNGWRQLYSLYAPMIVTGVYGAKCLYDRLIASKNANVVKTVFGSLFAMQLAGCLFFICLNHPHEYAYFNIFAGKNVQEKWDGDYWGVGTRAVFEELHRREGTCTVSSFDNMMLVLTELYLGEEILSDIEVVDFPDSDYIAFNRTYSNYYVRSMNDALVEMDEDTTVIVAELLQTEPVFEIKSGNCTLWSVYERP